MSGSIITMLATMAVLPSAIGGYLAVASTASSQAGSTTTIVLCQLEAGRVAAMRQAETGETIRLQPDDGGCKRPALVVTPPTN